MEQRLEGGYRLSGQSPVRTEGLPVVSIITVVYNGAGVLGRTIDSILGQTWPNIEYIIIDGASTDGTLDLILSHERSIAYWLSEPDEGLYDAMNKGLAAATGDYVWFMNAGDRVYRRETLDGVFRPMTDDRRPMTDDRRPMIDDRRPMTDDGCKVLSIKEKRSGSEYSEQSPEGEGSLSSTFSEGSSTDSSVIGHRSAVLPSVIGHRSSVVLYGDTMIVDTSFREVGLRRLRPPEVLTWKSFRKGMLVCHQAIIVSREIAGPYDLKYRHSADFDWVINALKKAEGARLRAQGKEKEIRSKVKETGNLSAYKQNSKLTNQHINTFVDQPIVNTKLILCSFLDGGHSKQNIPASLRERFDIMRRNYGLVPTVLRHVPIVVRFGWYLLVNRRF